MAEINHDIKTSPIKDLINLTPTAIKEIKRLIGQLGDDNKDVLRFGIQGGGCGGLSYTMAFDDQVRREDRVQECAGFRVAVDSTSMKYLARTTIDFSGELIHGGFKFSNPNAARGCGCGTSFSI